MKNLFWAALHLIPGIGSAALRSLKTAFGDGEAAWRAGESELRQMKFKPQMLSELIEFRQKISLEKLAEELTRYDVHLLIEDDEDYPARLRQIFDPPFLLYCRGTLCGDEPSLGVVGARSASPYGRQAAQSLSYDLAKAGLTIISGAAKGIDTQAHMGALKAKQRTIAVLGCGLDKVYPAENKQLLQSIAQTGAVISEYPLGTEPIAGHFPARNRIISGMSMGVLVVEAAKKSGSLITAELALSEGRDVFAVPGNIYSDKSQGCHKLIQQGAKLVTAAADIIEEYEAVLSRPSAVEAPPSDSRSKNQPAELTLEQLAPPAEQTVSAAAVKAAAKPELPPMTADEQAIYAVLPQDRDKAKSTDEIIYKLRINVSNIAFILLQMKLKGLIEEVSPNFYARAVRECVK